MSSESSITTSSSQDNRENGLAKGYTELGHVSNRPQKVMLNMKNKEIEDRRWAQGSEV